MIKSSLTEEEIETFTDVMVCKLSMMSLGFRDGDPLKPTNRDEIRQVIVDTMLLIDGTVPMERWLEGDPPRKKKGIRRG